MGHPVDISEIARRGIPQR